MFKSIQSSKNIQKLQTIYKKLKLTGGVCKKSKKLARFYSFLIYIASCFRLDPIASISSAISLFNLIVS